MIKKIIDFVEYLKLHKSFYTFTENLEERIEKLDYIPMGSKRRFLRKWDREILGEDLKWCGISSLEADWEITLDNIYIYIYIWWI